MWRVNLNNSIGFDNKKLNGIEEGGERFWIMIIFK